MNAIILSLPNTNIFPLTQLCFCRGILQQQQPESSSSSLHHNVVHQVLHVAAEHWEGKHSHLSSGLTKWQGCSYAKEYLLLLPSTAHANLS